MSAYAIFDVDIRDMAKYQEFMAGVKPALEKAGARYLARGGKQVYEGATGRRAGLFSWSFRRSKRSKHFTTAKPIAASSRSAMRAARPD